jgi:hypothetical protein
MPGVTPPDELSTGTAVIHRPPPVISNFPRESKTGEGPGESDERASHDYVGDH